MDTEDDPVPAKNGFVAADWADVFRQVAEEMWLEDDEMSVDAERARAELCGSCEGPGPWPIHLVHGSDEQVRIVRPTGVGRLLVSPPILEVTNECFGRDSPELEVMGPWASDSEVVIFIAYQETVKQFVDELPDDEREEIGELDWFCTGDSIRCFVTLDPLTLAPTHEDCSLLESGMEILPSVPRLAASLVRLIR